MVHLSRYFFPPENTTGSRQDLSQARVQRRRARQKPSPGRSRVLRSRTKDKARVSEESDQFHAAAGWGGRPERSEAERQEKKLHAPSPQFRVDPLWNFVRR